MSCISPGSLAHYFQEHPDSVLHTEKLMMRAAQFTAGGPELLTIGQVPEPELRERDVLVEVHATAINRADTLQVCEM